MLELDLIGHRFYIYLSY